MVALGGRKVVSYSPVAILVFANYHQITAPKEEDDGLPREACEIKKICKRIIKDHLDNRSRYASVRKDVTKTRLRG
jgi:hypothetical protein